jgi:hypothetical protein
VCYICHNGYSIIYWRNRKPKKKEVGDTSINELIEIAIQNGLSQYELSYFSLNELGFWVEGRRKRDIDGWLQTRYLAFMQIMNNGFIDGKNKPKRPEDLFYIEGDIATEQLSPEELRENYLKVMKAWHLRKN